MDYAVPHLRKGYEIHGLPKLSVQSLMLTDFHQQFFDLLDSHNSQRYT